LKKGIWAALFATVSLIAAGCGDDESGGSNATTGTTTESAKTANPEQVGQRIDALLDQIAREYDPAAPAATGELAAEAYLENYEVIEDAVKDADAELNERLELLLGAELRKQIREGASKAEIESMVQEAKRLVDQAEAALEQSQ
jgi:hypothetical protein